MIRQLLYRSAQLYEFTAADMRRLLQDARADNAAQDVTGVLAYRDGTFLQLLEGAPDVVDALYARVAGDRRHCDVRLLSRGTRATRLLPGWAMAYAEAPGDDDDLPAFEGLAPDAPALGLLARADDAVAGLLRRFLTGGPVPPGGLVCAQRWALA
ncbi:MULTISPECIES: BLUF domain-containing protein [Luteimonas]|jgi:hypothetical protein|uniref:BLUF domain-containing protein n=1 Tax=Luteimonas TaxID=83614 RepID=UPI000C7AA5B2|nr:MULTISPECIES: BLUF domain-containing protein [Luteimonas]